MECLSLLNNEQFYRSSGKRYPALMPYWTDSEARGLMLSAEGLLCVYFQLETCTYTNTVLKEQILFLMDEIMRIHGTNRNRSKTCRRLQPSLFLKKKSSGLLRLENPLQQAFYEEGVLDLAITGDKEGALYVYTIASRIHVNYFEFAYFFGTRH